MIRPGNLPSFTLLFTLAAFGPALRTLPAQQPAQNPPEASVPTLQVFSRETIVDVLVTNDKGEAVRGLKQSDFTISEDNKPQPMRSFGEFELGFADQPIPNYHPELRSNLNAAPAYGPVNIVLIDALHLNFVAANRSLQAVSSYAAHMPSGTQLAVFWLGASGLHMLQSFSSNPALIQNAVAVQRTDIGSHQDCYATDRLTIDAFNQIAAYVAAIKGRKNLVWFAPDAPVFLVRDGGYGWGTSSECKDAATEPRIFGADRSDGPALFTGPDGVETNGIDMTEVHRLMDTYELFTTEQIAVSPVNPAGVGPIGMGSLAAEEVAEQSGGIAQFNSNDLTARLAQAIDQGSHYYTLSYIPPRRKDDGHYHQIKIHTSYPGLHLVYRVGYNAEDPRQPRQFSGPDLIKAALQGHAPAATQLLFDAKLVPVAPPAAAPSPDSDVPDVFANPLMPPSPTPHPTSKPAVKGKQPTQRAPYDLLIAIPQDQITYGATPGGHTVNLQFAFDAYDLNGKFLGSHSQNFSFNLTPERYKQFIQAPVVFHERIAFLPGPLFLRVGVLDSVSNRVGTLEIPLTVPGG